MGHLVSNLLHMGHHQGIDVELDAASDGGSGNAGDAAVICGPSAGRTDPMLTFLDRLTRQEDN